MSHQHERKEKKCLNCSASLYDRYCHKCGQENVEPKQTFWGLITHFFNDVTHFDSKLWTTLKPLMLKPGFLTEEYIKGRRVQYLDPIRMYLFISFAFFLVFLSLEPTSPRYLKQTHPKITHVIDSTTRAIDEFNRATGLNLSVVGEVHVEGEKIPYMYTDSISLLGQKYYDSVQNSLPDSLKHNFWQRFSRKRKIAIGAAYSLDPYNFYGSVENSFRHSISKIFFISLPIFSFFLYLLYFRSRKTYYYVSHAIFSLHCYAVAFILLLVFILVSNKYYSIDDRFIPFAIGAVIAVYATYLLIAMKNFYKQRWLTTFGKFLLLSASTCALLIAIEKLLYLKSLWSMGINY